MPFGSLMFDEIRQQPSLCFQELPPDVYGALSEEGMELGLKAWKLVKAGCDKYTIHRKLQVPLPLIEAALKEFQLRVGMEAGRAMEHFRLLDCERINELIGHWMPVARSVGTDVETALKASYVILNAIDRQLQTLQAGGSDQATKGVPQSDILFWVQRALSDPASARKTPFLESEAEEFE